LSFKMSGCIRPTLVQSSKLSNGCGQARPPGQPEVTSRAPHVLEVVVVVFVIVVVVVDSVGEPEPGWQQMQRRFSEQDTGDSPGGCALK